MNIEYIDKYITEWYDEYGSIHRTGGPAKIWPNGCEDWLQHGELHRDGGPAVIRNHHYFEYWKYGKLHREDGPAIDHAGVGFFADRYYIEGKRMKKPEFDRYICKKRILKIK